MAGAEIEVAGSSLLTLYERRADVTLVECKLRKRIKKKILSTFQTENW